MLKAEQIEVKKFDSPHNELLVTVRASLRMYCDVEIVKELTHNKNRVDEAEYYVRAHLWKSLYGDLYKDMQRLDHQMRLAGVSLLDPAFKTFGEIVNKLSCNNAIKSQEDAQSR